MTSDREQAQKTQSDIIGAWRMKDAVEGIAEENDETPGEVIARLHKALDDE